MQTMADLQEFVTNNKKRIAMVTKQIKSCPKGKLHTRKANGKLYFIQDYYDEGHRVRKGINTREDIVIGLLRRSIMEEELAAREKIQKRLVGNTSKLNFFDLNETIAKIKKKLPTVTDEMISAALKAPGVSAWESEDYERTDYKPEYLRHTTSRGLMVRSKSEALIVERLYAYGIAFRYEQVLHIEGTTIIPDFTIRRSDGKIVLWEHEGLTSQEKYMAWQQKKQMLYASAGFYPWDNLIITYDDLSGNINLKIIDAEIQSKLIL